MKFEVVSKDFKNAADKALSIIDKKSRVPILTSVKITVKGREIIISTTNANEFIDVKTDSLHAFEEGCAYVRAEDIVKVYNLQGILKIESENGIFGVGNGKKYCEVQTLDFKDSEYPDKPCFDFGKTPSCTFAERDLIAALEKLKCFEAADTDSVYSRRPILSGFNINGHSGYIVACDSMRLGVWKINADIDSDVNVTVPGGAYKALKKVVNGADKSNTTMWLDDKKANICFKGNDYVYISRLLDGEYFSTDKLIESSENSDFTFRLDSDELRNTAKEYAKMAKKTELPMCFMKRNGELHTVIRLPDYQTADVLETVEGVENIPDNFTIFINPQYISEAAGIFDGEIQISAKERMRDGFNVDGIWIFGGEFKCMILPKHGSQEGITYAKELIDKIHR